MKSEIITSKLSGIYFYSGEIVIKLSHGYSLFFIVNNPCEKEFITKQALQIMATDINFYCCFYGKYSSEWAEEFNRNRVLMNNSLHSMVKEYVDLSQFIEDLYLTFSCRNIVPEDVYLIYDDYNQYEFVKSKLKRGLSL